MVSLRTPARGTYSHLHRSNIRNSMIGSIAATLSILRYRSCLVHSVVTGVAWTMLCVCVNRHLSFLKGLVVSLIPCQAICSVLTVD